MADVTPHAAFPLRVRAGGFVTVEQDSRRHREDQAEVVCRTRPGMLDHDPAFGLRDLVARLAPGAPEVLAAVARQVDGQFNATEGTDDLLPRVRNIGLAIRDEEQGDA